VVLIHWSIVACALRTVMAVVLGGVKKGNGEELIRLKNAEVEYPFIAAGDIPPHSYQNRPTPLVPAVEHLNVKPLRIFPPC
jgi:hypothetical protein